jgi:hypothetical protein
MFTRDLVHEIDDTTTDRWAYAHKRLGEPQSFLARDEIVDIGWG